MLFTGAAPLFEGAARIRRECESWRLEGDWDERLRKVDDDVKEDERAAINEVVLLAKAVATFSMFW